MNNLPVFISVAFILTTLITLFFFYRASHHSRKANGIVWIWVLVQSLIALTGFYTNTLGTPPRFILTIVPPVVFIVVLFITPKGRVFMDTLSPRWLTYLHVVRVPVELTLFGLFAYHYVPLIMTFEGRNLDILSGISAPLVAYYGYTYAKLKRGFMLVWNLVCLGLLINIVTIAILALPTSFQQITFDQPNIGVLYFPFVLLPACIVPLVLFSHLVCIRRLIVG